MCTVCSDPVSRVLSTPSLPSRVPSFVPEPSGVTTPQYLFRDRKRHGVIGTDSLLLESEMTETPGVTPWELLRDSRLSSLVKVVTHGVGLPTFSSFVPGGQAPTSCSE